MTNNRIQDESSLQSNQRKVEAWVVYGVEQGSMWPSEERTFRFEDKIILYRPETDNEYADISTNYTYGEDPTRYWNILRRFFSVLAWLYDSPVRITGAIGGSHRCCVGKPKYKITADSELEALPSIKDEKQLLALAIYRNALNAKYPPFSIIEFYRILELGLGEFKNIKIWIQEKLNNLPTNGHLKDISALESLKEITKNAPENQIPDYIYTGRCASAHGKRGPVINPDDVNHTGRIGSDYWLWKYLAEVCIEEKLGVKCRDEAVWKASNDWCKAMDENFNSKMESR